PTGTVPSGPRAFGCTCTSVCAYRSAPGTVANAVIFFMFGGGAGLVSGGAAANVAPGGSCDWGRIQSMICPDSVRVVATTRLCSCFARWPNQSRILSARCTRSAEGTALALGPAAVVAELDVV